MAKPRAYDSFERNSVVKKSFFIWLYIKESKSSRRNDTTWYSHSDYYLPYRNSFLRWLRKFRPFCKGQRAFYWLVSRINALSDALDKTLLLSLWWNSLKESLSRSLPLSSPPSSFSLSLPQKTDTLTLLSLHSLVHTCRFHSLNSLFLHFPLSLRPFRQSFDLSAAPCFNTITNRCEFVALYVLLRLAFENSFQLWNCSQFRKLTLLESSRNLWKLSYMYGRVAAIEENLHYEGVGRCRKKRGDDEEKHLREQTLLSNWHSSASFACVAVLRVRIRRIILQKSLEIIRWKIFQRCHYWC